MREFPGRDPCPSSHFLEVWVTLQVFRREQVTTNGRNHIMDRVPFSNLLELTYLLAYLLTYLLPQ